MHSTELQSWHNDDSNSKELFKSICMLAPLPDP